MPDQLTRTHTFPHDFVFVCLFSYFILFSYSKSSDIFRCEAKFRFARERTKETKDRKIERANNSIFIVNGTYVICCTFPISIDLAVVNIYDAISILTLVRSWNHWLINIYSSICVLCEHIQLRLKFPIHCGCIGILSITYNTCVYVVWCVVYIANMCVRVCLNIRLYVVCYFVK